MQKEVDKTDGDTEATQTQGKYTDHEETATLPPQRGKRSATNGPRTSEGEEQEESVLTKIGKIGKSITRALLKINTLASGQQGVDHQLDVILNEVSKLKMVTLEANQKCHYLQGKIEEMARQNTPNVPTYAQVATSKTPLQETPARKEEKAIIITSQTERQDQLIRLLKTKVNPMELKIKKACLRPGSEGVIVTSRDEESLNVLKNTSTRRKNWNTWRSSIQKGEEWNSKSQE